MGESQQSGFGKLRVDEREINDGVGKGWGDKQKQEQMIQLTKSSNLFETKLY